MKMKKFIRSLMGKQVTFTKEFRRTYKKESMGGKPIHIDFWQAMAVTPQVGWVVGVRWLRQGYTVNHGYEDGREFIDTGPRTKAILVVTYPTTNPIKVPPNAIVLCREFHEVSCVDEDERNILRKEVESIPRDSKGRFLASSPQPPPAPTAKRPRAPKPPPQVKSSPARKPAQSPLPGFDDDDV